MALSPEDQSLLDAFKDLKTKTKVPKVETAEDLTSFIKHYGAELLAGSSGTAAPKSVNVPRISIFFAEPNKGEVNYPTWKYEIKCLLAEKSYSEESLLLGIRRSCKGNAADKLRRLGTRPTIPGIIDRFDTDFGSIDSKETILKKFYNSRQEQGESLETYANRCEEMFVQAIDIDALRPSDKESLRRVLYNGLPQTLKQIAAFAFETEKEYDKFKLKLRTLENELLVAKETETSSTKTKCQMAAKKEEKSDMSEVKDILQEMNDRIKKLETQKESEHQYRPYIPRGRGTQGSQRGYSFRGQGPFRGQGRGRGSYVPVRPIASTSFQPRYCYICNEPDHLARDCPRNYPQFQPRRCYNCNDTDHIARNCPKNQEN